MKIRIETIETTDSREIQRRQSFDEKWRECQQAALRAQAPAPAERRPAEPINNSLAEKLGNIRINL